MSRGPGTEAAYRRLTEGRLWSGSGPGPWARVQAAGSTGSRASSVSDAVSGSASAQAAPKASQCKGRATRGRAQPLPNYRSPGRRARLNGRCRAEAEQRRRGYSLSPPGEARVGPGAHSGGTRPDSAFVAEGVVGLQGRRRAEAEQCRGGLSLSLPCKSRVGPGAYSGGVRPRFSLRSQRSTRLHGRRRVEAERRRGGRSLFPQGRRPGAHSCGVRQRFSLRCRWRARL